MGEFQDQLEASDRENVNKLIGELREICAKGTAGDAEVTPEAIKTAYDAAQQASLVLFQKVRWGRHWSAQRDCRLSIILPTGLREEVGRCQRRLRVVV